MLRLWILLLLCYAPRAVFAGDVRLVKAGFSNPSVELTAANVGFDSMRSRFFLAFEAPITANIESVTSPDGDLLPFTATKEVVAGANRVVRVRGVNPAWKFVRVSWQTQSAQGAPFQVVMDTIPPRELDWVEWICPAHTFQTPSGGRAMLDFIWPLSDTTQFFFSFRAPEKAPAASIAVTGVRIKGQNVPFKTRKTERQIEVEIAGMQSSESLAPLEFSFVETGFFPAREKTLDVALSSLSNETLGNAPPRIAKSANALARIYEETSPLGHKYAHAFISGPTEKPLQVWRARTFTQFNGEPKDSWRNQNESHYVDVGLFFRPDGTPREKGETYASLSEHGTQYRLDVERRREFWGHHVFKGLPVTKPNETLTFAPDEWSDETVSVRSVRFDAPPAPGKRGQLKVVLEFVRVFEKSQFLMRHERMNTPYGEPRNAPISFPHRENGHQEHGVFEFQVDVYLPQLPFVDIAFNHLEAEDADKREEIVVR